MLKPNENKYDFKISVVMAVYNTEKFLKEAIESIVNQSIGFEDEDEEESVVTWAPRGNHVGPQGKSRGHPRSEEHTSELQSHRFISYAVFCLDGAHV